ncbi:uncharacterized protein LOC131249480 [Magnolia sinica]|uniref:uncharacterized protein LOC131249480 n=1 Tax=Magnolia sinica TaxID=86752 RepID=UPI00265A4850|nr:uncharacterized protein LOC131249480 [Magnolia sinica]
MMNRALLGKWSCRLGVEQDALWNMIVKGKYGCSPGGWWTKDSSAYRVSYIWRGILRTKNPVVKNIGFVLGNGSAIRFWEDLWLGETTLKDRFPSIYNLAVEKNSPVASFILFPTWTSLGHLVQQKSPRLGAKNRILTIDNLNKKGMQLVNICLCCMGDEESVDHLPVHCPFISQILLDFFISFNINGCIPATASSSLAYWHGFKLGKIRTRVWRMSILAIWWVVWKERNDRCFNNSQSSPQSVGSKAKKLLIEWPVAVPGLKDFNFLFLGL